MSAETGYYGVRLTLRATGVLTFRRMPSAILHISTYPFIPPSTLSGWLRRLYLMALGLYPDTRVDKPDYFVMPQAYHVLGAYPSPNPMASFEIHTAKRQGVRAFNHNAFSRVSGNRDKKEVYQLHSWEYLLSERFVGFVLHPEREPLERITHLQNYGCKIGKEGYAFLEDVSPVQRYERRISQDSLHVPATGRELVGKPADLFVAYRHVFSKKQPLDDDPASLEPSQVDGYSLIWLGWPAQGIEMECFSDGTSFIPIGILEEF